MIEQLLNWMTSEEFVAFVKEPQIIAVFLTIILEILRRIFQPKACVKWGTSHGFAFSIPQNPPAAVPNLPVYTQSTFVENTGRAPAKDVEFYFNFKPEHFQIWPILEYKTTTTEDGRFVFDNAHIPHSPKKGLTHENTLLRPM